MTYTSLGDPDLVSSGLAASHTDRIEFAALSPAVRHARHWAADVLAHSDPPPGQDLIDTAVLLVSEDLDEILELADRILVIFDGAIVYETTAQLADRQTIGRHMAGHGDSERRAEFHSAPAAVALPEVS